MAARRLPAHTRGPSRPRPKPHQLFRRDRKDHLRALSLDSGHEHHASFNELDIQLTGDARRYDSGNEDNYSQVVLSQDPERTGASAAGREHCRSLDKRGLFHSAKTGGQFYQVRPGLWPKSERGFGQTQEAECECKFWLFMI